MIGPGDVTLDQLHAYLDALDQDAENEYLTLGGAMLVTQVREAVERAEA